MSFTDDAGNPETLTSNATAAVAARSNTPATGQPTISGTAQVGQTLTADASDIADVDGLANASFSYQWVREDGGTETDIEDATDSTYTLTDADEGRTIKVRVSFTDDAGNEETLTSAVTAAVARPNTPATGKPTVRGTAQVGETLTADVSDIDDEEGLANAEFSYQWVKNNGLRETDIEGATDSAYTLVAADLGKAIKVRVSFTDGGGHEEKLTSAATAVVVAWPITDTTGAPAITGNVRVGKTLTANTSQIANAHGSDDATFSYQWIRNDGTVDTEIGEANGSTYTLPEDDEDKTLKVRVTFFADAGAPESVTSAPTSLVKAEDADTSSNGQTIHLTFDDGPHPVYTPQLLDLLESYGARVMFFVNGVNVERYPDIIARMAADGHGIGNHTWGHERLTGLTEEEFTDTITRTQDALGAQGSMCLRPPYGAITHTRRLWAESLGFEVVMWTVEASDGEIARTGVDSVAARIASQVTDGSIVLLHDGGGHGRTVLAANKMLAHLTKLGYQFEPVCQPPELAEEESLANTPAKGLPTISGTAQVGEALTADVSDIDDQDGLENATFSYQWVREDGGTETAIEDATDSAYTLVAADKGKTIKVRVNFTDDAGNEESLTSAATAAVVARPNTPATGQPTISGTAQVGETLTADTSDIDDQDGLVNVAFGYQWIREDGGTDTDIEGATDSTYTLLAEDLGKTVKVRVSFTDDEGNSESLTSDATGTVAVRPNTPATGQPTISGELQVGKTLTADTSGIDDQDGLSSAEFNYQWVKEDGGEETDIEDATDSAYTLTDSDEGKTVKVRVSFTDDAGNEEVLTSAATEAVAARPNTPATGQPTIIGTARVGETLTAGVSSIDDVDGLANAEFSYQWVREDGGTETDIEGATDSTYTLEAADEGKTVKVRVTFTDDRGNEEVLTSDATEAIAPIPNSEEETGNDGPIWSATLITGARTVGYGYDSVFNDPPVGSLSPATFEIDSVAYTVTVIEAADWMYIGLDKELPTDFKLEVGGAELDSGDASFASYSYAKVYRWEEAGLVWDEGDVIEMRLFLGDEDSG